jgi:putative ABC transport system permease protein
MLILLANFIAWPLSYVIIKDWLNDFAYKTSLNILPFISGMFIALGVAFVTIAYFARKAAKQNIVKALIAFQSITRS